MDYKEKYLKYKNKYIQLKNQIGGESIFIHDFSEIPGFTKDIVTHDHRVVPMNSFDIIQLNIPGKHPILTTTGVVDCVVVMIYNEFHGMYLGHFLKYNEFDEALSHACGEVNEECGITQQMVDDCKLPSYNECEQKNNEINIKKSLPRWINYKKTHIHIFNMTDIYKSFNRFIQLRKIGFKSIFHLYPKYSSKEERDIFECNNIKIDTYIKTTEISDKPIFYEIFGIKPDGNIFAIRKFELIETLNMEKINLDNYTEKINKYIIKTEEENKTYSEYEPEIKKFYLYFINANNQIINFYNDPSIQYENKIKHYIDIHIDIHKNKISDLNSVIPIESNKHYYSYISLDIITNKAPTNNKICVVKYSKKIEK